MVYKTPHKPPVEITSAGFLRPMVFLQKVVSPNTIPTDKLEKRRYNAMQIAGLRRSGIPCNDSRRCLELLCQLGIPVITILTLFRRSGCHTTIRLIACTFGCHPTTRWPWTGLCASVVSFGIPPDNTEIVEYWTRTGPNHRLSSMRIEPAADV